MAAAAELGTEMQGFGRLAKVRRAVVPEDGETRFSIIRLGVVNMQPATVAQREVGLVYHGPTIMPIECGPTAAPARTLEFV